MYESGRSPLLQMENMQHFNRQLCRSFIQVRPSLLCNNAFIFLPISFISLPAAFNLRWDSFKSSTWAPVIGCYFSTQKKSTPFLKLTAEFAHCFSDYIKCNRELHVNVSMTLLSRAQLLINCTASPAADCLLLQLVLTNWVIPRRAASCWKTNLLRCFSPPWD